ncbi:MAG: ferredoxin [Desulfurococcales archaeon]|nr:ferredoxin [Desulfurococcales archaeon]
MVKVRVNKETCIGCGVCWSLTPEVFELDPATSKSRITESYRVSDSESESVGEVPDDLRSKVESAANGCPTSLITVE